MRQYSGRPGHSPRVSTATLVLTLSLGLVGPGLQQAHGQAPSDGYEFHDSHFHLTNYVQEGPSLESIFAMMGDRVGRSTVFGIPLQQTWAYENSGEYAPTYYLQSDAPLYYYSFTDAFIAMAWRALPPEAQARFDPMIIGFNPADMYGADHIRRVLTTFPGVFTGIGEFSIHKEFVSSKVAGEVASLTNPALDRILDLAGETGLLVLLHNDLDMPFARAGTEPVYLGQVKDLLRRHPDATIIWAHLGLGRVVRPVQPSAAAPAAERTLNQGAIVEGIIQDPDLAHVHFDISWDEVAKYVLATPEATRRTADMINRYPDRFLFGSDLVGPPDADQYYSVFEMYDPLWELLTPAAKQMITKGNYERLFDEARERVRAWERENGN